MLYSKHTHDIVFDPFKLVLFIFIFFSSCNPEKERKTERGKYYDLKGFVNSQIAHMTASKTQGSKRMVMEGKSEIRSVASVNWKRELELFIQADINKPAYSKSYEIFRPDSLTYNYTLKKGENLPVQKLQISIDSISGKPFIVYAQLFSRNRLYESQKDITFKCAQRSGIWTIISYQVSGYQKLAMMDKKQFEIAGTIN